MWGIINVAANAVNTGVSQASQLLKEGEEYEDGNLVSSNEGNDDDEDESTQSRSSRSHRSARDADEEDALMQLHAQQQQSWGFGGGAGSSSGDEMQRLIGEIHRLKESEYELRSSLRKEKSTVSSLREQLEEVERMKNEAYSSLMDQQATIDSLKVQIQELKKGYQGPLVGEAAAGSADEGGANDGGDGGGAYAAITESSVGGEAAALQVKYDAADREHRSTISSYEAMLSEYESKLTALQTQNAELQLLVDAGMEREKEQQSAAESASTLPVRTIAKVDLDGEEHVQPDADAGLRSAHAALQAENDSLNGDVQRLKRELAVHKKEQKLQAIGELRGKLAEVREMKASIMSEVGDTMGEFNQQMQMLLTKTQGGQPHGSAPAGTSGNEPGGAGKLQSCAAISAEQPHQQQGVSGDRSHDMQIEALREQIATLEQQHLQWRQNLDSEHTAAQQTLQMERDRLHEQVTELRGEVSTLEGIVETMQAQQGSKLKEAEAVEKVRAAEYQREVRSAQQDCAEMGLLLKQSNEEAELARAKAKEMSDKVEALQAELKSVQEGFELQLKTAEDSSTAKNAEKKKRDLEHLRRQNEIVAGLQRSKKELEGRMEKMQKQLEEASTPVSPPPGSETKGKDKAYDADSLAATVAEFAAKAATAELRTAELQHEKKSLQLALAEATAKIGFVEPASLSSPSPGSSASASADKQQIASLQSKLKQLELQGGTASAVQQHHQQQLRDWEAKYRELDEERMRLQFEYNRMVAQCDESRSPGKSSSSSAMSRSANSTSDGSIIDVELGGASAGSGSGDTQMAASINQLLFFTPTKDTDPDRKGRTGAPISLIMLWKLLRQYLPAQVFVWIGDSPPVLELLGQLVLIAYVLVVQVAVLRCWVS